MGTRAARSPPPAAGAASARLSILGLAPVFRKGRHANGAASAPVMACISQELEWSERRDLNPRPLVPQTSALTGLRYAPTPKGRCFSRCFVGGMQARSAGSRPRQGLERCRRERKGPESTAPPRFLQSVDIQPASRPADCRNRRAASRGGRGPEAGPVAGSSAMQKVHLDITKK